MDLVKAWGAAVLAFLLGSAVIGWVATAAGNPAQIGGGLGHILWSLVPAFVLYLLTALLAATFHGRDTSAGRHALAVLAVPVAALVFTTLGSLLSGRGSVLDAALSALVAMVATIGGWQIVDRLRAAQGSGGSYW